MTAWDVAIIGGGPAGLSAAYEAAQAGARTLVIEKAVHPRYKTCGGGLIGTSIDQVEGRITIPAADRTATMAVTLDGRREFVRTSVDGPVLALVRRTEFDDRLRAAAADAGAQVRQGVGVRGIEQDTDGVRLRLADGEEVTARTVIGADGSSGVTARHVGVEYSQVDLGLEVELPIPANLRPQWRGRVLLDWGPIPGSYGWVFPKDDTLTVGVIAARGSGDRTRTYLKALVDRFGLGGITPVEDSGHLTRVRAPDSPLRRDRVIVAGDAAGLLEPWTREGISFATRSGAIAGRHAGSGDLDGYETAIEAALGAEMRAGRRLMATFTKRPWAFHAVLASPPGWRMFRRWCRGETTFDALIEKLPVKVALALLS
ncbi:hyaluronate lyase [Asanoa ishikariensis]|uniref:Geranylgeranyl reductase family n=1 Tax=Asanoa ishikariensis TaxID=137265 RepID=A0A1H3LN92_9ACTN|nr:geranylgeranyl reductase family protein [Asanoa ishikariensis]GIF65585.1 hyaluronate lyase [Asanoa ishikariensis]SDY65796.1 geranylgeranyl reductase family [Asanoa ishikariensis]